MRKMLDMWTVSLTLTTALGLFTIANGQQTGTMIGTPRPVPNTVPSGAEWLRSQMAREAALRNGTAANVTVGYTQEPALNEPALPSEAAPQTQIQVGTQPPSDGGQATLQPSQQPASPIRKIPELIVPNTNLQGIGTGVLPPDVLKDYQLKEMALPVGVTRDGDWTELCACWQASGICHMPLYFEEPMLERHGQQRYPCLQPMISGVRFIGNIAMLPYYMQLDRPWEEQSVLGSYRPGTSAPALYHRPPYRADAVTAEGLATAAIFIAVP